MPQRRPKLQDGKRGNHSIDPWVSDRHFSPLSADGALLHLLTGLTHLPSLHSKFLFPHGAPCGSGNLCCPGALQYLLVSLRGAFSIAFITGSSLWPYLIELSVSLPAGSHLLNFAAHSKGSRPFGSRSPSRLEASLRLPRTFSTFWGPRLLLYPF